MRILTEAYKDMTFFLPLNPHKTEGIWARPISSTERRKQQQEALKEAGGDTSLAAFLTDVKFLKSALTDWVGMVDMRDQEIPFSAEAVEKGCEWDPDLMAGFATRVRNIARFGEVEDEKN